MGYSEVCCQLCGVSFSIGRVRKAGESLNAGFSWAEQGFFPEANFVTKETIRRDRCPPEAGCSNVRTARRCKLEGKIKTKIDVVDTWLVRDSDDEDSDWECDSEEDNEPLEWDEDCSGSNIETDSEPDCEPGRNVLVEFAENSLLEEDIACSEGFTIEDTPEGDSDNSNCSNDDFSEQFRKCNLLEHIAGAGCSHHRGYNGHNISTEEMIGSGTVQCLVRKTRSWHYDATDEEWELNSEYFLSGLGGYMQSRDWGGVKCLPVRHGLEEELRPDDEYWDTHSMAEWDSPMPFHPACLEVFKRVSRQHFGFFNVNGLGRWRWAECHYTGEPIDRRLDPALKRGLEQEWNHENGDEWLAANPVLIPALSHILQHAVMDSRIPFSTKDSAFSIVRATKSHTIIFENPQDPFRALPRELINLITSHLASPDIAALRLSSRAFTHLPVFLWKQLLLKEMPWLWEVWDDSNISQWSLVPSIELHKEDNRLRNAADEMREMQQLHQHVLKQEMPEYYDQYCAEHAWVLENVDAVITPAFAESVSQMARSGFICKLPQNRTNWFVVYTQATKHWKSLKGLRNRERIWRFCEDIVQRIQKCIEKGKIAA